MPQSMYYNWRKIDGYNAPITVVLSQRGLGKTFGKVLQALRNYITKGKRFVYVVETLEDVKTLSANRGERFFSAIEENLANATSKRKQGLYNALFKGSSIIDDGETELEDTERNKVIGGTIKVNNETAGYLIAINSFGNLKRNNFVNIGTIIIDEFIPEQIDIRHMEIAYKVGSIVQTVARRQDVKIYMLGNSIRLDDILLTRLQIDNMKKGEFRVIKDKYGVLVACHYVDPAEYPEFTQKSEESVSGRLSALMEVDNLEKNEFKGQLSSDLLIPNHPLRSHLLFCLHGQIESIRIAVTKDRSKLYCTSDYGKNENNRICFDPKYITGVVKYRPEWRDVLLLRYSRNEIQFESSVIHMLFKNLMKLDLNA